MNRSNFATSVPACILPLGLMLAVSGCATANLQHAGFASASNIETIAYEVGPCFGFCPIYNASVTSTGSIAFEGIRHTATIGQKTVGGKLQAYRSLANALAPYRPVKGSTTSTTCDTRISDQQVYRLIWTDRDGTKTVLQHDGGCRSPRNDALNAVMENAPVQLGIADWARQLTRPGAGRG